MEPGKTYRFRIIGMIINNIPIRFSIDGHTFSAIATDSLYVEEVENLTYLWLGSGERYDILVRTRGSVEGVTEPFKMRFLGFHSIRKKETAICSLAWLVYPGQRVARDYHHSHQCQDFHLLTPDNYPQKERDSSSIIILSS